MSSNAHPEQGGSPDVATALTLPQAAAYLGVHEKTVRRWIKDGRIAAVRVGVAGRYRIARSDLDLMVRSAA